MFVRRKHNKSGTTSIQVVVILASLEQKVKQWANEHEFGEGLFAPEGAVEYDAMMAGIDQDQLRLVGPPALQQVRGACLHLLRDLRDNAGT